MAPVSLRVMKSRRRRVRNPFDIGLLYSEEAIKGKRRRGQDLNLRCGLDGPQRLAGHSNRRARLRFESLRAEKLESGWRYRARPQFHGRMTRHGARTCPTSVKLVRSLTPSRLPWVTGVLPVRKFRLRWRRDAIHGRWRLERSGRACALLSRFVLLPALVVLCRRREQP